ncbi:helix-turn-helix domain-containing protein [Glaciecola siphonariae]|uniref:Helix-turn-helix domain-containing protein n=1 Tax=Glaciecola siphonariae TaxID=521012 RepID=A0ABV9LV03_9ALTE
MTSNLYQEVYPEPPLVSNASLNHTRAADLLNLEYFEAQPSSMPYQVFDQHHILINLKKDSHRVENWRDGEHRDFIFQQHEIIVTPAGVRSGWCWHAKSKVIVITLIPSKLEKFAQSELGILLGSKQLQDIPQFIDEDICNAAVMLRDAINSQMGSEVMFESFSRIFLIKLIQKYGVQREDDLQFSKSFTAKHYQRVLEYVRKSFSYDVSLEKMATEAGLSTYHFARLFKQTIGQTPHQFLMSFRVEKAKNMLKEIDRPMMDIAMSCGFADQAHFSRVFKQLEGKTPKQYRKNS